MHSKISKRKILLKKISHFKSSLAYKNKEYTKIKFCSKMQFKIINILFFLSILLKINRNIYEKDLRYQIKTTHKSKYDKYNYKENIIVKKDLFNDISYTPITKSNSIIKSPRIVNNAYFELCKSKTLLDKTKYKRNKKPKISVIISFCNKNKFSLYIPLRSIQNQTFKDIEIIYVDDGSSEEILSQLIEEMKNDNRIILLKHKENKGPLMTRVDGVRYASGEYILNLDQDDLYIDNHFFEKIYKKSKELNVDIIQFSTMNINKYYMTKLNVDIPKNKIITQPELKTAFFKKIGEKRFGRFRTRTIWDKLVNLNFI